MVLVGVVPLVGFPSGQWCSAGWFPWLGSPQSINHWVRRIWLIACLMEVTLSVEYVGADGIIAVGADALSRVPDDLDLELTPAAVATVWREVGSVEVDWFASADLRVSSPQAGLLPFCSGWAADRAHPDCLGLEALPRVWDRPGLAFPPLHLAGAAVLHALRARSRTVLILPSWPAQWWYPFLQGAARRLTLGAAGALTRRGPVSARALASAEVSCQRTWALMQLEAVVFDPAQPG